jgi:hypothetical protein
MPTIVNKSGLNRLPSGDKTHAIGGRERTYVETFYSFFKLFQLRFGMALAARFLDGAAIFGAESVSESFAPPVPKDQGNRADDYYRNNNNDDQRRCAHGQPPILGT